MKEVEAKTKWCPHTRMVFGYSQGTTQPFNRFAAEPGDEMEAMQKAMNGTSGTKCIGSECMMWEPEFKEQTDATRCACDNDVVSPEGDGWHQKNRVKNVNGSVEILWARWIPIDEGDCSLKTKELNYNV